ncbi:hypothetical protein D3C84_973420 [compost metagenome]
MQLPDHRQGERALAVEHLIDAIASTDGRLQILCRQPGLLHAELDGLDRVGQVNREVLAFIGFGQGQQHLEAIAVRGVWLWLVVEVSG